MKKIILSAAFLLIAILPMQVNAGTEAVPVANSPKAPMSAEVQVLMNRLEQIKNMDLSTLNSIERKDLRKEVKVLKSEIKAASGGVYLSLGAIVLVLILLIILL